MSRARPNRQRQAEVRAAARARRDASRAAAAAAADVDALERLVTGARDELAHLEAQTARALARRDAGVAGLRSAGYSWGRLALLAGTTRQALMKRTQQARDGD